MNKKTAPLVVIGSGVVILFLVAILALSGKAPSLVGSIPKNTSLQQAPVTNADADIITVQNELIADFPSFPLYPGATILESQQRAINESYGYEVTLKTKNSVAQVLNYYLNQAQISKWTVQDKPADMKNLSGEEYLLLKTDNRTVRINVEKEDDLSGTEITIIFPPQEGI